MKRVFFFAVVLLLAITLSASASPVERAVVPEVSFDGKYRHGKPRKVVHFEYSIFVNCDEGPGQAETNGNPLPGMKVKRYKFHGRFTRDGVKSIVRGKYAKDLSGVTGTLRVIGDVSPSLNNCDSTRQNWATN